MLGLFPAPYPDELLYSVIARYHTWSRNKHFSNTIEDVFGKIKLAAIVDFPTGLKNICERLPHGTAINHYDLIQNNSLFPLFRPFLPEDRVNKLEKFLAEGGENGKKIHASIGFGSPFQIFSKHLRYCPECLMDDRNKYGEVYWHRSHQINAVTLCHRHLVPLIESQIKFRERQHKYSFNDLNWIRTDQITPAIQMDFLDHDRTLARAVFWLLNNQVPLKGPNALKNLYLNRFKEAGFATTSGNVRLRRLINEFILYFGEQFLLRINCEVQYDNDNLWLKSFVHNKKKTNGPVQHILVMQFLGYTPQQFFQSKSQFLPFGEAPWPCLNPAANHYLKHVVKRCDCKTNRFNNGLPLGTFYCECGFVYTRLAEENCSNSQYQYRDVRSFGHVWIKEVHRLKKQENMSIGKIAKKLNADYSTVKKYLQIKGGDIDKEAHICYRKETHKERYSEDFKNSQRSAWIEQKKLSPEISKTALCCALPRVYRWLLKNDSEWLYANSPMLRSRKKYYSIKLDWSARDEEILKKVKIAAEELLSHPEKPKRITIHAIGYKIGAAHLLSKKLNKLPKTMKYIIGIVESVEQFQIRKIKHTIFEAAAGTSIL
ncbi:TnsD family transposase [Paenibacillus sp. MBLB4367]|uniref:TnsD family transposase n=1 Tax=Paenibacillus sp. MBLB4367 TaxID=3384767 RepID=UPI003908389A